MASQHTPGPWEYFEQDEWRGIDATYGCVRGGGFTIINGCAPGGRLDEQKANARLIAAAPDLLEAARHAYTALFARVSADQVAVGSESVCLTKELIDLQSAIAKATT